VVGLPDILLIGDIQIGDIQRTHLLIFAKRTRDNCSPPCKIEGVTGHSPFLVPYFRDIVSSCTKKLERNIYATA
jgi:hypothetical protein